jgi:hypothetical protein
MTLWVMESMPGRLLLLSTLMNCAQLSDKQYANFTQCADHKNYWIKHHYKLTLKNKTFTPLNLNFYFQFWFVQNSWYIRISNTKLYTNAQRCRFRGLVAWEKFSHLHLLSAWSDYHDRKKLCKDNYLILKMYCHQVTGFRVVRFLYILH